MNLFNNPDTHNNKKNNENINLIQLFFNVNLQKQFHFYQNNVKYIQHVININQNMSYHNDDIIGGNNAIKDSIDYITENAQKLKESKINIDILYDKIEKFKTHIDKITTELQTLIKKQTVPSNERNYYAQQMNALK